MVNNAYKEMGTPRVESNKYITLCLSINIELMIARWAFADALYTLGKADDVLA